LSGSNPVGPTSPPWHDHKRYIFCHLLHLDIWFSYCLKGFRLVAQIDPRYGAGSPWRIRGHTNSGDSPTLQPTWPTIPVIDSIRCHDEVHLGNHRRYSSSPRDSESSASSSRAAESRTIRPALRFWCCSNASRKAQPIFISNHQYQNHPGPVAHHQYGMPSLSFKSR